MNLQNRKRLTDLREWSYGCWERMWEGIVREFGVEMYTLLYLTRRTNKDLLSSTGDSALSSVITLWSPAGRDEGRDSWGVWDGHGHSAVFNMENQQGPAGQHRGLCSVSRGSLDGRGVWGRMHMCICMAEFLHCSPETITILLLAYTPIQGKKFKKDFKKVKFFKRERNYTWKRLSV